MTCRSMLEVLKCVLNNCDWPQLCVLKEPIESGVVRTCAHAYNILVVVLGCIQEELEGGEEKDEKGAHKLRSYSTATGRDGEIRGLRKEVCHLRKILKDVIKHGTEKGEIDGRMRLAAGFDEEDDKGG